MELLVAADDRTGALETAAALADRGVDDGHGVPVTVWPDVDLSRTVTVVDLERRHLAPEDAARRAGTLPAERLAAH